MANVPAIEQFSSDLNVAVNTLLQIRDVLNSTDTLWPSLTGAVKQNIHNQVDALLTTAKAQVAALQVP